MFKTHVIYKTDKWNMLTVEVQGRHLILREISQEWGEDTHHFLSRPAMMNWAEHRFPKEKFVGKEDEWQSIMDAFKQV
ncbi:hypothetical protein [Paenibacillus sp. 481]|uniref:hypothetical protein n=1 Tax=Paenibacillus sp. 481 TaxID=2835869 RepID=UPI001E503CCA|nr:hypothetical protein [Paenibacillus sp. 481]UHA72590.1 hypothetical protein KIK04_18315 [Paenibacillus sp. 481]